MKACPFGVECDACRFFRMWRLVNDLGQEKFEERCGFEVLMDEIPKFRGSVDGCQQAANETRNRVVEFGTAAVQTLVAFSAAAETPKLIGNG